MLRKNQAVKYLQPGDCLIHRPYFSTDNYSQCSSWSCYSYSIYNILLINHVAQTAGKKWWWVRWNYLKLDIIDTWVGLTVELLESSIYQLYKSTDIFSFYYINPIRFCAYWVIDVILNGFTWHCCHQSTHNNQ